MEEIRLGLVESRFADIIWEQEPLTSRELVLLCQEKLIREEIPVEPHDYPIPWVLTERGLYEDGIPARLG